MAKDLAKEKVKEPKPAKVKAPKPPKPPKAPKEKSQAKLEKEFNKER